MKMEPWVGDLLNRREIADFLTSYIDHGDELKVLNINSSWGTGKTFFLQNWHFQLLLLGRPSVYFNAWESDFSGDPLLSIVANIKDELSELVSDKDAFQEKSKGFLVAASSVIVKTLPVVAGGLLKRYMGVDSQDLQDVLACEAGEKIAEGIVEKLIESNRSVLDSVEIFKKSLQDLTGLVSRDGLPVYIFIDELDRCRPTYAIELLERVKHLFSVPGCAFIIASDTRQLSHSVNAVYGNGFSSREYLKRFFDLSYTFEQPDLTGWIKANVDYGEGKVVFAYTKNPSNIPFRRFDAQETVTSDCLFNKELTEAQLLFHALAKAFRVDLRQLERINKKIKSTSVHSNSDGVLFYYIAYLTFLLDKDEDLFDGYAYGTDNKVMQEIMRKYPTDHRLYLGSSILSVHEIAGKFFSVKNSDMQQLRSYCNDPIDAIQSFALLVNSANRIDKYPRYVKLAARIS